MALEGVDCSRHQGIINWTSVRNSGKAFAFLKATDGIAYRYVNWYHQNSVQVRGLGMVLGAYHFLLDHHPGEQQARYYVSEVTKSGGFTGCVPIVDIEREADGTTPRLSHLEAFVHEFWRLVPNRPILIYTGRWYWVGVLGNPVGAHLGPLWHSEYDGISPINADVANGPELDNYGGWKGALCWQYTSSGIVPGIAGNCDRNVFYGSIHDLNALAGGIVPPGSVPSQPEDYQVFYVVVNEPPHEVALGGPGYWHHLDGAQHAVVGKSLGRNPESKSRADYDILRAACLHGERCANDAVG